MDARKLKLDWRWDGEFTRATRLDLSLFLRPLYAVWRWTIERDGATVASGVGDCEEAAAVAAEAAAELLAP